MGRPKKPVDPMVLLRQRREAVAERFFQETKIALNEEHKRLIADFVLKERDRERLLTIQDVRYRIVSGQITAATLIDEESALQRKLS